MSNTSLKYFAIFIARNDYTTANFFIEIHLIYFYKNKFVDLILYEFVQILLSRLL